MEPLKFDWRKGVAFIVGLAFLAELLIAFRKFYSTSFEQPFAFGKVEPIGKELMTHYLFPFEMISVVLLAALVGAIVIAKKHN